MGIADEVRASRGTMRVSAQRVFSNRVSEVAAFQAKLAEVRAARQANPDLNLDLRAGRMNVLNFYGLGGIGKTRLSQECQSRFLEEQKEKKTRRASIRFDFSEPSARDAELYLLALRAGLAPIAKSFPAFDTGLALYWERKHPGLSMVEFVRNQSFLGSMADRETFAGALQEMIKGLVELVEPFVGGASRTAVLTWERIRETRAVRALERECPYLAACGAEEDVEELRLHLPVLLGWDLSRLQRKADVDVAVFLDAFEHVSSYQRKARRGDVEDAIARSLFFLPSVLFVVAGRNRLDWGTQRRAASLEYAGEAEWPGLGEAGRDRIRVGALDAADCHAYLQQCLLDEQGDPAMPEQVRAAVSEFSDGMPLYLDVAANHYRSLLARGHTPGVDDFARGVPDLVLRLMEDLDDNACDLLRAAALLGVFDHETLHIALPDMRAAHIEHFLDRSLVFARDEGLYSIHEVLQTSVRLQDAATGNQWSPAEWGAVQQRLVAYWSSQMQDDEAAIWRDRRAQALAFWQLVNLYATTDVEADVLADVVMQVQLRGVWTTIDTARDQPEPLLNEHGRALLHMLDGMMERQVGSLDEAERLLSAAVNSQSLTPNVRRLAMYYLGETRDVHVGDSLSLFREISQQPDRLGIEAQLALAHALARQGDLVGSLEIANAVEFDEDDPEFAYRHFELLGVIWWSAGRLETSAEYFERSRQVAQTTGSPLLMGLALRHLGLAMCWSGSSALTVIEQAESLNRDLGMKPGIGQCLMTRATATTGTAPPGAVDGLVDDAVATFRGAGYLDDALGPLAVSVFAACVGADRDLALHRREHLYQQAEGRRPRHWLAITDVWTGESDAFNRVAWPQGAEQAWRDWEQVLHRRRSSAVG